MKPTGTPMQTAIKIVIPLPRMAFAIPPPVSPAGSGSLTKKFQSSDRQDRKSTRLNSSHLGISYAVFCLKKKTYENMLEPAATHTPAAGGGTRHERSH